MVFGLGERVRMVGDWHVLDEARTLLASEGEGAVVVGVYAGRGPEPIGYTVELDSGQVLGVMPAEIAPEPSPATLDTAPTP